MKRTLQALLATAAILWMASHCYGQVTITGPPETVKACDAVTLEVVGADPLLVQGGILEWSPRDGISVKGPHATIPRDDKPSRIVIECNAHRPGEYTIRLYTGVMDEKAKMVIVSLAEYVLTVEGENGPDPPIPDPPAPGKRFVLVWYEAKDKPSMPGLASTIVGLGTYLEQSGNTYRLLDKDPKNAAGEFPPWLSPYVAAYQKSGLSLPVLMVTAPPTAGSPGSVVVEPLPLLTEKAVALVKKHGG